MSAMTDQHTILFPEGYDEQREFETPAKGYLPEVVVRLEDGSRFQLFFYDPVRLQQDLMEAAKWGKCCLAEPNIVVVPEVTTESIRKAVEQLVREGYFQYVKPL
jgi:hypothetical protein